MKKKETNANIFDLASRESQKRKPTTSSKPKTPPASPEAPSKLKITSPAEIPPPPPKSRDEVQKMLNRMHELHQKLESQLEETVTKSGVDTEKLVDLVEKVDNKTRAHLKEERRVLEEKVWGVLGEQAKNDYYHKEQAALGKARKAKTGGSRRKWISTK